MFSTSAWRRVAARLLLCGLAVPVGPLGAQEYPDLKRIFVSDTLAFVWDGQLSPDGRWVVMSAARGSSGPALFLGRVGTNDVIRLTTDGFGDYAPLWFPGSDRIAFTSDRPNRNGSSGQFGMVLDIDPRSGAPRGSPRQVTLEPVGTVWPSPDGNWLAYNTLPPGAVKLIPAAGGTSRTLVALQQGRAGNLSFSLDGESVSYSVYDEPGRNTIERVALEPAGAKPVTLATISTESSLLRADPRFRVNNVRTQRTLTHEVRTLAGELVGEISAPAGARGGYWNADGWGRVAFVDTAGAFQVHLVSSRGGAVKDVSPAGKRYSFVAGWDADGSRIVSLAVSPMSVALVVSRLSGDVEQTFPLVLNDFYGIASGLVGSEIGLRMAGDTAASPPPNSLIAMNVRTGATRTLSANAAGRAIHGPGGDFMGNDRFYWAEGDGERLTVFAETPGAAKEALRTFALPLQSPGGLFVHGKRIAWREPKGDSIVLLIADDATSSLRPLIGFRAKPSEILAMAWSNDGRHIALSHHFEGQPPGISIIDVPARGAAPEPRLVRVPGNVLSIQWLPGDDSIITRQEGLHGLARVSIASGERVVLNADDPFSPTKEFAVSPDGESLAYSVQGPGGTIIYSVDYRRVVQAASKN